MAKIYMKSKHKHTKETTFTHAYWYAVFKRNTLYKTEEYWTYIVKH